MLPASTASSIQKRRQHHRRQQSLEVPILATPLPHQHRRTNPGHRLGHRRGLSLDQSLSAMNATSGFRPLMPQDMNGQPIARTQHPDTNIAYPPDQQHLIKQETQEHSLAQPGYQQPPPPPQAGPTQDFQSHLHQQLNGIFNPSVSGPHPQQAAAMQQLQHHMMWYEQNYGNGNPSNPSMQNAPFVQVSHPVAGDMAAPVFLSQPQMQVMPTTPISHGHAQTVPSTPQNHAQSWPSPPPSNIKHQRSQSYQLDVAPMPPNADPTQFAAQGAAFANGSFGFPGEQEYAASAYSSSVADASSPPHQHSTPMPTLFEETTPEYVAHSGHPGALMYQAGPGAEQDFNSPHFMMGGGPMCPEQAALDAAGIDATYIDTGISEEQINSWLVHPTGKGDAYRCKWEGCNTKINRKENARSHVQNHLDDRRFRCNPCGKRFNRLHDTKRHHLTHTNERPAVCPCGKTFARADALTRHRQRDMCEGVLPGFEKLEEDKPKRGRPKKDRSGGSDKSKKTNRPDYETRMKKAALARSMDGHNFNGSISSAPSECSMPHTPPQDHDELDANDFLSMDGGSTQFNTASNTWLDTPPTSPPSATQIKSAGSKIFIDLSIPEEQPELVSPTKLSTRSSPVPNAGARASSIHGTPSPVENGRNLFADHSSPTGFASGSFHGDSSPMDGGVDIFNDAVNFDVLDSHPDVGRDVFSPPGESCSGSSVYNSDWDHIHIGKVNKGISSAMQPAIYSDSFENIHRGAFSIDDFMGTAEEDQYNEVRDILDSWVASH